MFIYVYMYATGWSITDNQIWYSAFFIILMNNDTFFFIQLLIK